MNKPPTVLWIDDDPQRSREAENLKNQLHFDVKFIDVKKKNLLDELRDIKAGDEPTLILMDHRLNNVNENAFNTGATAAEVIREKWSNCPIVCVTAAGLTDIDLHKQSIYEEVFQWGKISSHYSTLSSIATSFHQLKENSPKDVDDFIDILKVPDAERNRLISILPKELKSKELYSDNSLLLTISRWVRHILMEKPGFLYDRLWTATLLGLKEESLVKVEEIFSDAKYTGIFSDSSNERWWQAKLREILFSSFPGSDEIYPWKLGRQLPGIKESDYSKCHSSGEDFPETVAFIDEKAEKRVQVRIRYTVPHPNFEKSLFFEEMRMMKGAE